MASSPGRVSRGTSEGFEKDDVPFINFDANDRVPMAFEVAKDEDDETKSIRKLISNLSSDRLCPPEDEASLHAFDTVPDELLRTSSVQGLDIAEVYHRRKKYGYNRMKEEKENLILKFLFYFVGPIQFVMEVCQHTSFDSSSQHRLLQSSPQDFEIGSTLVSLVHSSS